MAKKKEEKEKTQTTKKVDEKQKKASRDANGRFKKGHPKEGGRVAGTPNKTSNIRDRLKEQLEPFIGELSLNLIKVQKEEGTAAMMSLMEKFMPYYLPKLSAMSLSADQDRPINEEERLLQLDALYTKKELSINFKTMTVVNNDKLHATDPDADEDDFDISQFDTTDD